MLPRREREPHAETTLRATWLCAGCRAVFGPVTIDHEPSRLTLETPRLSARVTLPVTRLCDRCGTPNHLTPADLARWRRRGGHRPLVAVWPPTPGLARPAPITA
jgi:hypothetical protein